MEILKSVKIDNQLQADIIISDEEAALMKANVENRAAIGVIGKEAISVSACKYLVENFEQIDEEYLQTVAYRHLGLPIKILETENIIIRELCEDDFDTISRLCRSAKEACFTQGSMEIFSEREKFYSYIRWRYAFYGYGIWALVRKVDGKPVGIAGFCDFIGKDGEEGSAELGYLIDYRERRKGYAYETADALIAYGKDRGMFSRCVLNICKENKASFRLAQKLQEKYGEILIY